MVFESEISQVANHESQKISSFSVLGASSKTLMFFCQIINNLLLGLYFKFSSFEQDCAKAHSVWIEFHDLSDEVFFRLINYFMELIFFFSFQWHSKNELLIIN